MIKLNENETISLVIHKHWFVLLGPVVTGIILFIIPPVVLSLLPLITKNFDPALVDIAASFALSLYVMIILLFLFLVWMNYHLDAWIITTKRIIDIEQRGLFSRQVSEIPIAHVQDITIEVNGLAETFLKFGTIRLQTAGEREFAIEDIPHIYEAKDLILKYSQNGTKS